MNIKTQLLEFCKKYVDNRLKTVQETIISYQNDLQSETKSSAGDKHETGRAMLQLEMEKVSLQLAGIQQMSELLNKIDVTKKSKIAHLGSVVYTQKGNYFLSISAAKCIVIDKEFYAVSMRSPIGKVLLGTQENDEILLNGNTIKILKID